MISKNVPPQRLDALSDVPRRACDVAVVGGGVVGNAVAMTLARNTNASVVVVEAEQTLASHQTGNNSGVIHSGLYYKPGSLKATLCVEGRDALYRFCQEHGVAHEKCGKIVVATNEAEIPALDELQRRGTANGLTGLRRLTIDELRQYEPHVAGIAGLHVQETGIANYRQVTAAYAQVVRSHGGRVCPSAKLIAATPKAGNLILHTSQGDLECRGLVNCAGLQSDRVARLCGLEPEVKIVPFRGEYYELAPHAHHLVRNLIYPVPNPEFPFLGVHFTRMVGGGIEAGPNAVLALSRHGYSWGRVSPRDLLETAAFGGFWRMVGKYWKTGFGEMYRSMSKPAFCLALQKLIPEIRERDIQRAGAGVRAQALDREGKLVDDFRIQHAERMVHVLNAPSPAATASLAIGRHIAEVAIKSLDLPARTAVATSA